MRNPEGVTDLGAGQRNAVLETGGDGRMPDAAVD